MESGDEPMHVEAYAADGVAPAEQSQVEGYASSSDEEQPTNDPFEEEPLAKDDDGNSGDHHSAEGAAENAPLLWTVEEETVLMHSSEASLKRIQARLENLLLGVSHAIRVRETRGDFVDRKDGSRAGSTARHGSTGRSRSRVSLDFGESLLMADHAIRRLVGEAFGAFEEAEVVQMVQLCSLADKGAADCGELVRNAVVVLQALTHDGEAVRSVEHFRGFVEAHREEMSTQQWRHDYVTAIRSLAVGFLRKPVGIMASYGSSIHQLVEHEALYVALLRLCGSRPVGNAPQPKEMPDNVEVGPLNMHEVAGHTAASKHAHGKTTPKSGKSQAWLAASGNNHSHSNNRSGTKNASPYIHTPKKAGKSTHARRVSTSQQQQQQPLPSAEHLEAVIGMLISEDPSGPSSPATKVGSRRSSAVGPTPAQLHELHKPISHNESAIASEHRASASCARSGTSKPVYEPIPQVPQRLSVSNRARTTTMSHY